MSSRYNVQIISHVLNNFLRSSNTSLYLPPELLSLITTFCATYESVFSSEFKYSKLSIVSNSNERKCYNNTGSSSYNIRLKDPLPTGTITDIHFLWQFNSNYRFYFLGVVADYIFKTWPNKLETYQIKVRKGSCTFNEGCYGIANSNSIIRGLGTDKSEKPQWNVEFSERKEHLILRCDFRKILEKKLFFLREVSENDEKVMKILNEEKPIV